VTHQGSPLIPRVARESLPPALQDSEIKVALKVFVNAAGRPLKVVILKGGTPEFNEAAQNAALTSTYAPGTRNGKPASGWLNMEFNFGKPR
jgi:TonB family protein